MGFNTFLAIIGTVLGIVSILVTGAIWVLNLTSKFSIRAYALEQSKNDHDIRLTKLESDTSFKSLRTVFSEVCFQVFHSKEFKEANKEVIRETLLHIDQNRTAGETETFAEILREIREVRSEIKQESR